MKFLTNNIFLYLYGDDIIIIYKSTDKEINIYNEIVFTIINNLMNLMELKLK